MNTSRLVGFGAAGLILIVLLIWHLGSTAQSAPAQSQNAVTVAIIALIGTLFTGAISLVGLLFKDAMDRRSSVLQSEAERRLRMETALRAVELMTTAEAGGTPAQESREAALLVVSSLNQPRLALTLGNQLWRQSKISTEAFVNIADQCFASKDDHVIHDAAVALEMNAAALSSNPKELSFPPLLVFEWKDELPASAKYALMRALIKALLSKPHTYWDANIISSTVFMLYRALGKDSNANFRRVTAHFVTALLDCLKDDPRGGVMLYGGPSIPYAEIHSAAEIIIEGASSDDMTGAEHDLLMELGRWKLDRTQQEGDTSSP